MNRRDFIRIGSIAGSGTLLLESCAPAAKEAIPVLISDDPIVPGEERWKSTTCLMCEAGCGIQVRWINGNAVKVEGNPLHPVNRGRTCARGQAALQALYNPDRIRQPLRRLGRRGEGKWKLISWDEALGELATELKKLCDSGKSKAITFATNPLRGSLDVLARRFAGACGITSLHYLQAFTDENIRRANLFSFGRPQSPTFDMAQANYVLSVGAPFLESWKSPVHYALALGEMRQGRPGRRGKFVQVEPRLSLTAASADEWVPLLPGTEGAFVLALAHVLVRDGLYAKDLISPQTIGFGDSPDSGAGGIAGFRRFVLQNYSPQQVAPLCKVRETLLERLARELSEHAPAVVLGGGCAAGGQFGYSTMWAVNCLNLLLGTLDKPGGWAFDARPPLAGLSPAASQVPPAPLSTGLGEDSLSATQLLIVRDCNPVHESPGFLRLAETLQKSVKIVTIAPFSSETSALADLVLPESTFFESWQDDVPESGAGQATWSLVQPVLPPLYETRSFGDILLQVARLLGPAVGAQFSWPKFEDVIKAQSRGLFEAHRGSVTAEHFDEFWEKVRGAGGWWDSNSTNEAQRVGAPKKATLYFLRPRGFFDETGEVMPSPTVLPDELSKNLETTEPDFPFHLHLYASSHLGAGEFANLPFLQETPDPMTRVMWGSSVEVSPALAAKLRLQEGDWVWVESAHGRIRTRVRLYPGLDLDVVAIAAGQGHTDYGRYAKDRGANPLKLLSPVYDRRTGVLAWAATRVRLSNASA